ncbi:MAG: 23S rRNA (uracil(1939)-C(5))-methyltransferase RlmD [Defluviitaleaceae bacterium]|nr:23S rRNA (uracil(1939)-C(5))-methyltransferase RlmD [Defluviitaleaceae bacterium]MCL2261757.1 23S rRNA (uracil(1939)-C(5))-methyltransferase RlmD [Defluviitaleaceae bacterium]
MLPLKNSQHEIEIKDVTAKGFGIGYIGEFVVFIDGGLTGDVIETHIVKVKKRYGYGKIARILTPSPFRKESPCAVSETCGGCQWQHCEYSAQLKFKKQIVKSALEKIGGLVDPPVSDVIGMDNPERYRNKAVFPVVPEKNEDGFAIGMYAPRSHRLIEVADCGIQHIAHVGVLSVVKKYMRLHKIAAYDETTHRGTMRHIVVRTSLHTGEIMVVLVAKDKKKRGLPAAAELVAELTALGVTTVLLNCNNFRGNTIFGNDFEILSGEGFIREKIGEVEYQLSAPSFFQVNPVQTRILYEAAISQAQLDGTQTVIDAHAGTGGVALFAAKHAKHVLGVDIVESAVQDAQKNAELNGITNTEFICGAAEDVIPEIVQRDGAGVVFLDPPRKGCDPILLDALISATVPRIVYISCDPATLARDVKHLTSGGFTLTAAQPVDMFPFTGKVETSVLLQRKDS